MSYKCFLFMFVYISILSVFSWISPLLRYGIRGKSCMLGKVLNNLLFI